MLVYQKLLRTCKLTVSFQSMSYRIIPTSHKEKPDLICSFLMILILLTLVSAQGKQMSFTNQAANVIKLDKMILQSNKALKDIKPKRPLEPIIFQRFCLKTKVYSMNCPEWLGRRSELFDKDSGQLIEEYIRPFQTSFKFFFYENTSH